MSDPTTLTENFAGSLGSFAGVDPIRYDSGLWVEQAGTNYVRDAIFALGSAAWSATRCTVAQDATVTKDGNQSGKVTVTDASGSVRATHAATNSTFAEADPARQRVFLRCNVAGRSATVTLRAETNAGAEISTVATQTLAIPTTDWAEFELGAAALPATTQRVRMWIELTGTANGNEIWIVQPQIEKAQHLTSFITGGAGTGYAFVGTENNSASTRDASSASVTIAEPASVACWYREGYSGAKTFAYLEPYGTLGTYGSIAWAAGDLTLSTSRNLVIGPFAAFDRALTATEQANLKSTQNWSMNSVNGSNIILPLSGRRRPR